jgi:hypothetical protein
MRSRDLLSGVAQGDQYPGCFEAGDLAVWEKNGTWYRHFGGGGGPRRIARLASDRFDGPFEARRGGMTLPRRSFYLGKRMVARTGRTSFGGTGLWVFRFRRADYGRTGRSCAAMKP